MAKLLTQKQCTTKLTKFTDANPAYELCGWYTDIETPRTYLWRGVTPNNTHFTLTINKITQKITWGKVKQHVER